jgi:hypothetical protein
VPPNLRRPLGSAFTTTTATVTAAAFATAATRAAAAILELLTYVDGKGWVVVEVEAFKLVVTEDDEDVRVDLRDLLPQDTEAFMGPVSLGDVRRVVLDRDVFADRAVQPPLAPEFSRQRGSPAMGHVKCTNEFRH